MHMKNPPHPGELIGDNLDELGVTVSDAAKALGISRQQLHNVIGGRYAITAEMAKGFTLYMVKAVLSGKTDEIIDLAKTNLWR